MDDLKSAFAQNLRQRRRELGLTQERLGELVNYSEKSISKWEQGAALPCVEVLVKLAKVLAVDPNTLLSCGGDSAFYLGIDGGGTKTAFALADESGRIIKTLRGSACNPFDVGMKRSQEILEAGIKEICTGISLRNVFVFAGISGGITSGNQIIFQTFFEKFGFARARCDSDIENAIGCGLRGKDGIAVILGTGSVVSVLKDGTRSLIGGNGYLFDESCSGFELGRDAIAAVLRDYDGSGVKTRLTPLLEKACGGSVPGKLADFYAGGKTYVASFAHVVFEAYAEGDATAERILRERVRLLAVQIRSALGHFDPKTPVPTAIVGGITHFAKTLEPLLLGELKDNKNMRLCFCQAEPVEGALFLAGAPMPQWEEERDA